MRQEPRTEKAPPCPADSNASSMPAICHRPRALKPDAAGGARLTVLGTGQWAAPEARAF